MLPQMTLYNLGAAPIIAKLCRIAGVQEAVKQHVQHSPAKSKISPGLLIESMIINILSDRQPLYRLKSFWENQDLNLPFHIDGLDAGQFNDDAYGCSLGKLADAEPFKLVSSVCLNMAKAHDAPIKQLHFDTTSKSVQGVYESTTEDPLITLGHSKDHRPI
ncbi:DUF4277 domain-containing protein [Thermotalea metallivorans]|uniref:DUF4277 domain-containing protein n=1 Tax=Thermotalea metallivorans TaxID=520762 RepID=A0A140KZ88_9FIRM|nr:DUF4277 domain-containing protein [Thermotalea metallivorans]KXG73613.1 hypothetical protein AN619_30590 [Thermotalea metallivorans]